MTKQFFFFFYNSDSYTGKSFSNTSFKTGSETIDQDLFTIASDSEENLGMKIMELNKFKSPNYSNDAFENDVENTLEQKQALHKNGKYKKIPIPEKTSVNLENHNFSCSLEKTYVETEALSMIEKLEMRGKRGKRTYKCNVCQKITKDKYNAMRHTEKHIDGLMYGCLICDFSSVTELVFTLIF